jgi:hypothetical protein
MLRISEAEAGAWLPLLPLLFKDLRRDNARMPFGTVV